MKKIWNWGKSERDKRRKEKEGYKSVKEGRKVWKWRRMERIIKEKRGSSVKWEKKRVDRKGNKL